MSTATDGHPAGTRPRSPLRLGLSDWVAAVRRAAREFVADDCVGLAGEIAYSSILAFFPALIFLTGLLGLLGVYEQLKDFLGVVAPADVIDALDIAQQNAARTTTSLLATLLGAAGAAWWASSAMYAVVKAVNRAYDRGETRPQWKVRAVGVELMLATAVATTIVLVLVVFGGPLGHAIAAYAHLGGAFDLLWAVARWPIAFAAILLFFALVYYLAPDNAERQWKWISPGSVVGALLWLALSGLFAVYTSLSDSYSRTYGALAAGIVLLLWLNYSALALLFGAELNAELDRQAAIRAAGGPRAGLTELSRRTR